MSPSVLVGTMSPALVVAIVASILVSIVTGSAGAFIIVLVAGTLLGWLATLAVSFEIIDHYEERPDTEPAEVLTRFMASLLFVGPLVVCVIAVAAVAVAFLT